MLQLAKCAVAFLLLLVIYAVWGRATLRILKIEKQSLPQQVLAGLCAFFIVMEIVLLPVTLRQGSLTVGTMLAVIATVAGTGFAVGYTCKDRANCRPTIAITPLFVIAVLLTLAATAYAVLYRYMGWDQTYYIGTVESFVETGSFWTRDAMNGGIEVDSTNIHYTMSVFYPLAAILCQIFAVDARIMMLYTVRAMCVILSAMVVYEWGRVLIPENQHAGNLFVCIYTILTIFATASHSAGYMALIRGYEAKGYCAAVVMPLIALFLVQLLRRSGRDVAEDADCKMLWRSVILVSWASIPLSPSSLALVPIAVVIASLSIVIVDRRLMLHLRYAVLALVPNILMMIVYVMENDMLIALFH